MEHGSQKLTRAQMRVVAESEAASPAARLDAAEQLLAHFGLTSRNERILRRVARELSKFVGDPRTQVTIRERAGGLRVRIKEAEATGPVQDLNEDEDTDTHVSEDRAAARSIVGNTQLLPSDDDDDPYWSELIGNRSRRQLFLMSWGFDSALTHSEIIGAMNANSARLESITSRQQLWALSRDQADTKFERDSELVRAALAERGLQDDEVGREELAKQVVVAGEPLVQFRKRNYDPEGTDLPVLVRSTMGQLLDAIAFTKTWPQIRPRNNQI